MIHDEKLWQEIVAYGWLGHLAFLIFLMTACSPFLWTINHLEVKCRKFSCENYCLLYSREWRLIKRWKLTLGCSVFSFLLGIVPFFVPIPPQERNGGTERFHFWEERNGTMKIDGTMKPAIPFLNLDYRKNGWKIL